MKNNDLKSKWGIGKNLMRFNKSLILMMCVIVCLSAWVSAECPEGMVSYWKLDGTSGSVIDSIGDYHGINDGATRGVAGKVGDAFSFSGTEVKTNSCYNISISDFTVSAWFKTNEEQGTTGYIFTNRATTSANQFALILTSNEYAEFITYDGGTSSVIASTSLKDGNWHHIVGVREGTNMILYIDGISVISGTKTIININTVQQYAIGGNGGGHSQHDFYGTIDEVAIFNRALSTSEIAELYDKGVAGNGYCYSYKLAISNPQPSNNSELEFGTTNTTLGISTNSNANCSYSTSLGQDFSQMTLFSTTGGTSHNSLITGLTNGGNYDYYIKCNDTATGNITDDYHIHFNVSNTAPPVCPSGMVSYWTFDNDDLSESNPLDTVGSNHGTTIGATTGVTGQVLEAFSFDGVDNWVNPNYGINLGEQYTLSYWFKANSLSGVTNLIGSYDDTGGYKRFYAFFFDGSTAQVNIGLGESSVSIFSPNINEWYFVAFVHDGNGNVDIYIDDAKLTTYTYTPILFTLKIPIGAWLYNNNPTDIRYFFNGTIDEVAIYNTALSAEEISDLYDKGVAGNGYCYVEPSGCTDIDNDGYGATGSNFSLCNYTQEDCNDNNLNIYPGATEIKNNGIDENCDGVDATVVYILVPDFLDTSEMNTYYVGDDVKYRVTLTEDGVHYDSNI